MNEAVRHFVVCVKNQGHEESLDLRKIYEVLDDAAAAQRNMIRDIDEEEEDYLYPKDWFVAIELPHDLEEAIVELTHA
jgi:hypothetical protein